MNTSHTCQHTHGECACGQMFTVNSGNSTIRKWPSPAALHRRAARRMMLSIWACAFALAVSGAAHAQTYDAVIDFSLAGNPNGVWRYGILSTFTGGTFTLFNRPISNLDYTGELRWDNSGSIPNAAAADVNRSGSEQTSGS